MPRGCAPMRCSLGRAWHGELIHSALADVTPFQEWTCPNDQPEALRLERVCMARLESARRLGRNGGQDAVRDQHLPLTPGSWLPSRPRPCRPTEHRGSSMRGGGAVDGCSSPGDRSCTPGMSAIHGGKTRLLARDDQCPRRFQRRNRWRRAGSGPWDYLLHPWSRRRDAAFPNGCVCSRC
jgi:hypothetical protein